jgi:hypothetical protein
LNEQHEFDPNVNIAYSSHDQRLLYTLQDSMVNTGLRLQNINTRLLEVENMLADNIEQTGKIILALEELTKRVMQFERVME